MKRLKTGIRKLDGLLGGGLDKGRVTLLIGETGVGKTTLLMAIARNANKRVAYIDCEGNPIELLGDHIMASEARTMDELISALETLSKLSANPSLLIVDGLTYHYHVEMRLAESDGDRDRAQRRIERVAFKLQDMAWRRGIAVIASTWPTAIEEGVVGGFAVKAYSRIHLRMRWGGSDETRILEVLKHQDPKISGRRVEIGLGELRQGGGEGKPP